MFSLLSFMCGGDDGISWVVANGLNTARRSLMGSGLQSAVLSAGGWNGDYSAKTEEYF